MQSLGYSFPFRVSKILREDYKTNFTFSFSSDLANQVIFVISLKKECSNDESSIVARGPPEFQAYRKFYKRRGLGLVN